MQRSIVLIVMFCLCMGSAGSEHQLRIKELKAAMARTRVPLTWKCDADTACEDMLDRRGIRIENIFPCSSIQDGVGCTGYAEMPCNFSDERPDAQGRMQGCVPQLMTVFMEVDRKCQCHIFDVFVTRNSSKVVKREMCEVYLDE